MVSEKMSGIPENADPFKTDKKKKSRLLKIKEKVLESDYFESDIEKTLNTDIVFIMKKKKVVAHAGWVNGDLVITKIRRPGKTKLQLGEVLYKSSKIEIPPRTMEIKTEGWVLYRNKGYDSNQAVRKDPFWEDYEGWFLCPDKIDGENGMDDLLDEYPEVAEIGFDTLKPEEVNQSDLRMALFSEVNDYVCGKSEKIPDLKAFKDPKTEDMIRLAPSLCLCGCGSFEGWHRFWVNRWIVYVPRKKKLTD